MHFRWVAITDPDALLKEFFIGMSISNTDGKW